MMTKVDSAALLLGEGALPLGEGAWLLGERLWYRWISPAHTLFMVDSYQHFLRWLFCFLP
jgi:hypothetical protein